MKGTYTRSPIVGLIFFVLVFSPAASIYLVQSAVAEPIGQPSEQIEVAAVTTPSPRSIDGMTYDPVEQVIVIFGGRESGSGSPLFGDTWEFDLTTGNWTETTPTTSPSARYSHSMVYDANIGAHIMFGGWNGGELSDTWLYFAHNDTWIQGFDYPYTVCFAGTTYDEVQQQVVGYNGCPSRSGMYSYDVNAGWQAVTYTGTTSGTAWPELTYDSMRQRIIEYGGWDGVVPPANVYYMDSYTQKWSNANATGTPFLSATPIYNAMYDVVLVFSGYDGSTNVNGTWAYYPSTANWAVLNPDVEPPAQRGHGIVYIPDTGDIIIYGGYENSYPQNTDMWRYSYVDNNWTQVAYGTPIIDIPPPVGDTTAPDVSSPPDMTITAGTMGNTLSWQVGDSNPYEFTIYVDGIAEQSNTWVNGSIDFNLDYLPDGMYDITVYVYDMAGNVASDTVFVMVEPGALDISPPDVSSPPDMTITAGTMGNTLSWQVGDRNPDLYEIYVNGLPDQSNYWINGSIDFNLDYLGEGYHEITIYVYDMAGNVASDTIYVMVESVSEDDNSAPDLYSPGDYSYEVGTTGHQIFWEAGDRNPDIYDIYLNGSYYDGNYWNNGSIGLGLDGLPVGTYNFTIVVYDTYGNTATDSVWVNVYEAGSEQDITPPSLSSAEDMIIDEDTTAIISWQVNDPNPGIYRLYLDDELVDEANWSNEDGISYNVFGLSVGLHRINLEVCDTFGNCADDEVEITVEAVVSSSFPASDDSSPEDTLNSNSDNTLELNLPVSFEFIIIGIIVTVGLRRRD